MFALVGSNELLAGKSEFELTWDSAVVTATAPAAADATSEGAASDLATIAAEAAATAADAGTCGAETAGEGDEDTDTPRLPEVAALGEASALGAALGAGLASTFNAETGAVTTETVAAVASGDSGMGEAEAVTEGADDGAGITGAAGDAGVAGIDEMVCVVGEAIVIAAGEEGAAFGVTAGEAGAAGDICSSALLPCSRCTTVAGGVLISTSTAAVGISPPLSQSCMCA